MSYELWVVAVNAVILLLLYGLQGTDTILNAAAWGLGARDEERERSAVSARAVRTVRNQIEAMMAFVPLVLVAQHVGISNQLTIWGAGLFLGARVLFVPLYLLGVPYLRTLVWGAGYIGTGLIAYAVLTSGLM